MTQSHTTGSDEQMSDLPQRLRDNADIDEAEGGNPAVIKLERDAADHIEQLRAALSQSPAAEAVVPSNYIDFQQKRGALADIIDEALAAHAQWLLDDDYDAQGAMQRIMDRMRERRDLYLSPNQPAAIEPVAGQAPDWLASLRQGVAEAPAGTSFNLTVDQVRALLASQPSQPAAGAQGDDWTDLSDDEWSAIVNRSIENADDDIEGAVCVAVRLTQERLAANRAALASAQPIEQKPAALSRQELVNRFDFLEGACSEGTYDKIIDTVFAMLPQRSTTDSDVRDAVNQGIELAVKWVEQRREDFMREHGYEDPETGAWEYGTGKHAEAKHEYETELAEIADGIRALKSSPSTGQAGERE
jgi:hypothetical protein